MAVKEGLSAAPTKRCASRSRYACQEARRFLSNLTIDYRGFSSLHLLTLYIWVLFGNVQRRMHDGGEGGIRTLDALLTHTPLAGERFQPLSHFTGCGL